MQALRLAPVGCQLGCHFIRTGEDHGHGFWMERLHHLVGIGGEKGKEFMFARSRRAVRSARPFPSGPDPCEEEQRLRLVEREPVARFALRQRIRHLPVFREGRRRDDATVLNPEPLLPVAYPGVA